MFTTIIDSMDYCIFPDIIINAFHMTDGSNQSVRNKLWAKKRKRYDTIWFGGQTIMNDAIWMVGIRYEDVHNSFETILTLSTSVCGHNFDGRLKYNRY